MSQILPLKEVREQLSELISKVAYGDQKVVITKFGKPVAALVTYEDFERMMNPRKRFSQRKWDKGLALMDKMRANTKNYSPEEVETAIEQAVSAVRQK